MARTLTSALLSELGKTVTRPGLLVEIAFPVVMRLSSMGDVAWDGKTWTGADIEVRGVAQSPMGDGAGAPTLMWGNTDLAAGALVLTHGVDDRAVRVWAVYAGALALADAVMIFDGVGDAFGVDERSVSIRLSTEAARVRRLPHRFVSPATGFNHLQPAGTRIVLGGQTYVLERGR